MTTFRKLAAAGLFAAALFTPAAQAAPILANGGFETGDFSGWTFAGLEDFNVVAPDMPNTGSFSALFGEQGADASITQTLALTAGQAYKLSFWLSNLGGGDNAQTISSFSVMLDGASLLGIDDKTATGFTGYSVQFTAAADSADLAFRFRHDDNFWVLDDVAIAAVGGTEVPEPATLLLFGTALALAAARRKRA